MYIAIYSFFFKDLRKLSFSVGNKIVKILVFRIDLILYYI